MDQNMENTTRENKPAKSEPHTPPQPKEATSEQPVFSEPPTTEPIVETSKDAKMWGMFCHLGGLAMFLSVPFPFSHVIVPLILWLIKKDDFKYVDEQGKEALNFQISIAIAIIICIPLCFIVIGLFLLPVVAIFNFVMIIIASIETSNGNAYRYPLTLRIVK
jgi:uncharacterized Tic20 family protein